MLFPITLLFWLSFGLTSISLYLFYRGRVATAVFWLIGAAVSLRLGLIGLDPFLHDWDERFHALVAKNLLTDPLRPLLRADPVLPYNYQTWCCNHIWLHKQPLFLWQIALSFKLFGVNEIAVRIPSALLGSLLLWPIYRIGRLIVSATVGYYAALLLAFAYYPLELTTGWQSVDHADIAFGVYTVSSLWAYYESQQESAPALWWSLLAGALAGAAVLCKWLPGLVVYACWIVDSIIYLVAKQQRIRYKHFAAAFLLTLLIVLPWQLYTQARFPLESNFERSYATSHFNQVLEGKGGTWYFYLTKNMWYQYQWLILLLAGGLSLFLQPSFRKLPWRSLLVSIGLIFGFFSAAATKMPSYTYVVGPLVLVLAAAALVKATEYLSRRSNSIALCFVFVVVMLDLRPVSLLKHHSNRFANSTELLKRQHKQQHTTIYRQLDALTPPNCIIFNAPPLEEVEAMFYSQRNVYSGLPEKSEYLALKKKGVQIAVLSGSSQQKLPEYINISEILLIPIILD